MLVYGDAVRRVEPQVELEHLSALLERLRALPPGLGRHSALVGALILAGELAQGLADAAFKRNGRLDMEDPSSAASMALLLRLAGAVERSWNGGFTETGPEACAALTITTTGWAATAHREQQERDLRTAVSRELDRERTGLCCSAAPSPSSATDRRSA